MVMERPRYGSRKRIEKVLLYKDGRQRTAHLGIVDQKGCFCYMLDTDNVEHFEFDEMSDMVAELEGEISRLKREVSAVEMKLAVEQTRSGKLVQLCNDILVDGEFPKGYKKSFTERLANCAPSKNRIGG